MPSPGQYAELLRIVGQMLDAEMVQHAEIVNHEGLIRISWHTHEGAQQARSYEEIAIHSLLQEARSHRGSAPIGRHGRAELLRTLGQELDREHISLGSIVEEAGGYRTSGIACGRFYTRFYTEHELRTANTRRHIRRAPPMRSSVSAHTFQPLRAHALGAAN
jgi:hypothetical protein